MDNVQTKPLKPLEDSPRIPYLLVPLVIVVMLAAGLYSRDKPEVYPLASWEMFSRVPSSSMYYTLLIYDAGKDTYRPPILLRDVPRYQKHARDPIASTLIDAYGNLLANHLSGVQGLGEEVNQKRVMVENLLGNDVQYAVVVVMGDPLKMVRKVTKEDMLSLGIFKTPPGSS